MRTSAALMIPDPTVVRIEPESVRADGEHERVRPADPDPPDLVDALRKLGYAFDALAFEMGIALDRALTTPVIGDATLLDILADVARRRAEREAQVVSTQQPVVDSARRDAAWHKRRRRLKGRRG